MSGGFNKQLNKPSIRKFSLVLFLLCVICPYLFILVNALMTRAALHRHFVLIRVIYIANIERISFYCKFLLIFFLFI